MTWLLAGTSPRRSVLLGLASAVLGLSGARRPNGASAKKSKKLERNAFGCVNVGRHVPRQGQELLLRQMPGQEAEEG
jgi:hypothetical protein